MPSSSTGFRLTSLYSVVVLVGMSTGALYPLVALALADRGLGGAAIGSIASAYYLGALLATAFAGKLLRRLDQRSAIVLSAAVAATTSMLLTCFDTLSMWLALRFLCGCALGLYYLSIESWLARVATIRTRGQIFGGYEAIRILASSAGPIVIIIGSTETGLLVVTASFALATLPLLIGVTQKSGEASVRLIGGENPLGIAFCSPLTASLTVVAGLLSGSFYGLGAIYAEGVGLTRAEAALFVSLCLAAPAITQLPVGAAADRFGRIPIAFGISLTATALALILWQLKEPQFAIVAILGAGVFALGHPLYALGLGSLADHRAPGEGVAIAASCLLGYSLGTVLGPIGAAQAMELAGPSAFYLWIAACLASGGALALATLAGPKVRCCPL